MMVITFPFKSSIGGGYDGDQDQDQLSTFLFKSSFSGGYDGGYDLVGDMMVDISYMMVITFLFKSSWWIGGGCDGDPGQDHEDDPADMDPYEDPGGHQLLFVVNTCNVVSTCNVMCMQLPIESAQNSPNKGPKKSS